MTPIHVEEVEILRIVTIHQDIHQDSICRIHGHMIRDNVLNPSHVVLSQLRGQRFEVGKSAQLRIQLIGVNHIVAVEATLCGSKYWRSVHVGYAQVRQIGDDQIRGLKTERRTELNSIGRCWSNHEETSRSLQLTLSR